MNDATEFESSFAGTIDFFQNLRRKLGALEADAGAQHDRLRQIADSLAAFEQYRQTDRQDVAALAERLETQTGQLAELRDDVRRADEQLAQIESLAASLQQEQRQAHQTLGRSVDEIKAQSAGLRHELEVDFAQRTVAPARVAALEERLSDHARHIEGALADLQNFDRQALGARESITAFESRLQQLDQNAQTIAATLTALSDALERHGQTQDALGRMVEASQALGPQLEEHQGRVDALARASTGIEHDVQALREDFSRLTSEVETQHRLLLEAGQNRQDLQKQQERLKHLETLVTKLSGDTSSTRQILNVLQADLAVQSDTLREFDQTWREGWSVYQNRLEQVETAVAESSRPASAAPQTLLAEPEAQPQASPFLDASEPSPFLEPSDASDASPFLEAPAEESPFLEASAADSPLLDPPQESPFLDPPPDWPILNAVSEPAESLPAEARFESLLASLASTREEQRAIRDEMALGFTAARDGHETLRVELSAVQDTLQTQYDYLSNLRDIIAEQLQAHQSRLGEFESALDALQQTPAPADASPVDFAPLRDELDAQAGQWAQIKESVERQIELQQQRLNDLEAALGQISRTPAPAETDLQPLHDALIEHASALALLRQETQQQLLDQTDALDRQRSEWRETAEQLALLQQDFQQAREQSPAAPNGAHARESDGAESNDFRQRFEALSETIALLDNRLTGQAQAFTSNFAQFQGLNSDLQALQQHIAHLEPSPRLGVLERGLAAQEQEIAQLTDDLQRIKRDTERGMAATHNGDHAAQIAAVEEKIERQQQQLSGLAATVETVRADSRATQEKVLTMAANVAQRLHEFQNQLIAAKTAQGEQLQAVEQKLILLQVAVETMETQKKPRRWFSMPASFTTVVATLGATLLAVVAQAFWAFGTS